jgi:hypothetical protein
VLDLSLSAPENYIHFPNPARYPQTLATNITTPYSRQNVSPFSSRPSTLFLTPMSNSTKVPPPGVAGKLNLGYVFTKVCKCQARARCLFRGQNSLLGRFVRLSACSLILQRPSLPGWNHYVNCESHHVAHCHQNGLQNSVPILPL